MDTPTLSNTALLLFSHGSVLCGADRILEEHASRLRGAGYASVEYGFLNYSAPSFEDAVARCHAKGARRIVVVPYFLVAGRFVTDDLPPRIAAAREAFPEVEIVAAEALLDDALLADAVVEMAAGAVGIEEAAGRLRVPLDQCELRTGCPLYNTADCPRGIAGE